MYPRSYLPPEVHSNYICFQLQLSVIQTRKTNAITQRIFGISFCRQLYVLVEAGTAMLSIDVQAESSFSDDHFLIPSPILNSIILHLGCKWKKKLLCSTPRTAQHTHVTVHVSYIQDEQDIFSMTSRHQATSSTFPGEKEDPSEIHIQPGMASAGWHIMFTVPAEQSKATILTANCSTL